MSVTTAIVTGDVINSREASPKVWLSPLKATLKRYGSEPLQWEIYRGDSFQLEVAPADALKAAFHIKASLKQKKGIDIRMGIGLGEKDYQATTITESNGTAFVRSGECFQQLKKQHLAIQSGNTEFDTTLNLMIRLAALTMDHWMPATSRIVKTAIEYPKANQHALAAELEKSQSTISEALIRAGYDEIKQLLEYYQNEVMKL